MQEIFCREEYEKTVKLENNMDKIDPTLMSYLKGPYGAASLPSLNDVNKMQLALPGYGESKNINIIGTVVNNI